MPFFSVVIPLFNKELFIEKTIKSVLDQTFVDFELLIINDGSTDNSELKVLDFNDPRINYFFKKNEGVSKARNTGIHKATGEFVCFLDADDYWYPDFLSEFYKIIQQHPEQKVFTCAIEIETSKRIFPAQYSIKKTTQVELVNYFETSLKQSIISTSSIIAHKDVFTNVGLFKETIKTGEDTDLWIRIGLKYSVVFINSILARYNYDGNGLSRKRKDFSNSLDYSIYQEDEKNNSDLKKFLDYNRFSDAIKAKLYGNVNHFKKMSNQIDVKILPVKKRILLNLPSLVLKLLIGYQKKAGLKSFFK